MSDEAAVVAVQTGFAEVDSALGGGLRRGSLTVIGGHAGAGAAVLARQIACRAAAEQRIRATYLAVGTLVDEVEREAIAGQTRVRISEINHATDSSRREAIERIFAGRLQVQAPADRSARSLLMSARLSQAVDGCEVVVIDSVDLLDAGADEEGFAPCSSLDSADTADFLRQLRVLALDHRMAIVVTADLPEMAPSPWRNTADHLVTHLAALGPAAQVADTVLMVYRSDMWDACDPRSGEADVVVVRAPRCHTPVHVTVAHQLHLGRFVDLLGG